MDFPTFLYHDPPRAAGVYFSLHLHLLLASLYPLLKPGLEWVHQLRQHAQLNSEAKFKIEVFIKLKNILPLVKRGICLVLNYLEAYVEKR